MLKGSNLYRKNNASQVKRTVKVKVNEEADFIFDENSTSDVFFKMRDIKFDENDSSIKTIEALETQLETHEASYTNFVFSGFYGLSANEKVMINIAMEALFENSVRTLVACYLASSRMSDSPARLKDYLDSPKTRSKAILLDQVLSIHNQVTNATGFLEFNDVRKKDLYRDLYAGDEPVPTTLRKMHKLRHYTAELRHKLGNADDKIQELAKWAGSRLDGECNEEEWNVILCRRRSFFDCSRTVGSYPDSCSEVITRNVISVNDDMLDTIYTRDERAYLIYKSLASLRGKHYEADILYKIVLDEYRGTNDEA